MEATVEVSPALPSPSVPSGTRGARPGPMARHERLEEDVNRTEEAELRRMETNAEMEMMETDATAGDAEGEGCQGAAEAEEEVEEVCGGEQGEERDQASFFCRLLPRQASYFLDVTGAFSGRVRTWHMRVCVAGGDTGGVHRETES